MFEVTLANYSPACRALVDHVDEAYGTFFLIYKCSVGFAMLNVINGVFLHETFKAANNDDEIMIMTRERAAREYVQKIEKLFDEMDATGNGLVSIEEFRV